MKYPITITFIATDHSVLGFPSWPSICDVIKKSLSPVNPHDTIIKAFEKKVLEMYSADKLLLSLHKSLETQCDDKFTGTLHCKAVLASMALYPKFAIQDDIAKVLSLPGSIYKSDPMLTGIEHWGYQGVKALLSSLLQAFPLFTAGI
jgi:hypothetical protein